MLRGGCDVDRWEGVCSHEEKLCWPRTGVTLVVLNRLAGCVAGLLSPAKSPLSTLDELPVESAVLCWGSGLLNRVVSMSVKERGAVCEVGSPLLESESLGAMVKEEL